MNILAIETSTEYLSVSLTVATNIISRDCLAKQQHSELLLPMVEEVLQESNVDRSSLTAIAFGVGPGSFTGLRIACGVAQGLAFGLGIPVIPISTLEAMAEASGQHKVVVALDARMEEIYFAALTRINDRWERVISDCLCKPQDKLELSGTGWFGVGNGFAVYKEKLLNCYSEQLSGIQDNLFPHSKEVARLALQRFQEGIFISPEDASPVYIRNRVALTIQERSVIS